MDKKAALHEAEEVELQRELRLVRQPSKAEERKIRLRVRKRITVWAKEAGIPLLSFFPDRSNVKNEESPKHP